MMNLGFRAMSLVVSLTLVGASLATQGVVQGSGGGDGEPPSSQNGSGDAEVQVAVKPQDTSEREVDPIGDLLYDAVYRGTFPGSIRIDYEGYDVSMRIGGFVKAIAYYDTNQVLSGDNFLPSTITGSSEDSTDFTVGFTRLNLDARSALPDGGKIRSFIETDLMGSSGDSLRIRHAFGEYDDRFLAGQYWSGIMDLGTIPQSVAEATVSGAMFKRPVQFRWTESATDVDRLMLSIEEPDNGDITFTDPGDGKEDTVPTVIGTWKRQIGKGHTQLGGLVRYLEYDGDGSRSDEAVGWGFQLSGAIPMAERDRIVLSGSYGEGIGSYLLGTRNSAAVIDSGGDIETLENYGAFAGYRHAWNDQWWSNLTAGFAKVQDVSALPDSALEETRYLSVNLIWTPVINVGVGIEWNHGFRENVDGSDESADRFLFAVQFF